MHMCLIGDFYHDFQKAPNSNDVIVANDQVTADDNDLAADDDDNDE